MIRWNRLAAEPLAPCAFFVLVLVQCSVAQTPSTPPKAETAVPVVVAAAGADYSAGPDDLLSVTVLEAPDLSRPVRVSASGEISLPLIGVFRVTGLPTRAIELMVQERLRETYMRDPHVSVQVLEMQSHPVSVMGAVNKPGTFQIRGARTLLEILSLAEGLAPGAGDTAIVMRQTAAASAGSRDSTAVTLDTPASSGPVSEGRKASSGGEFVEVKLKDLLQAKDPGQNVMIYPGDIVKVMSAGLIYIVGEVNKPGAFPMNDHEKLTILRALALGEGLKPTAAGKDARVIRTSEAGSRLELPINLNDILKGRSPDVPLQARDVVFVPNSRGKSVALGTADALVRMITLRTVLP
jgi:polysaccharide export outer membrane protein